MSEIKPKVKVHWAEPNGIDNGGGGWELIAPKGFAFEIRLGDSGCANGIRLVEDTGIEQEAEGVCPGCGKEVGSENLYEIYPCPGEDCPIERECDMAMFSAIKAFADKAIPALPCPYKHQVQCPGDACPVQKECLDVIVQSTKDFIDKADPTIPCPYRAGRDKPTKEAT
jgi:hypothetical protein